MAQAQHNPTDELRRQQEREREQRSRLEPGADVHIPAELPAARGRLPESETPCFRIERILIQTAQDGSPSRQQFRWLTNLLAGAQQDDTPIGQCLGAKGIGLLIGRAQDALMARGFVTSRVLAQVQNLSTGTLTLTVVPGRIHRIRFAKPEQTKLAIWNNAATDAGKLLNLRDIEQTLENLKRVGAINGRVIISAGHSYNQTGSDVLTPKGDIDITAQAVNIKEGRETGSFSSMQRFEQSGLTVGIGGGIIDTAQATAQAVQGVANGSSNRSKALNALIAYGKGADLIEQGQAMASAYQQNGVMGKTGADGKANPGAAAASGIKVSISLGTSSSQNNSSTETNTAALSTVKAGGDINIRATKADLTLQGSNVSAGRNVTNMLDSKYALGKVLAGNAMNSGSASQSDASTTTSAISAGTISVGGKTTDTSKDTLTDSSGKTVRTDTGNTNRTLARADVAGLQQQAQQNQADSMLVLKAATAFTDATFKAAFLDQAKMYKKVVVTDQNGKPSTQWQEMTPEEKARIPPGSRVSNNGIFTGGPNEPQAAQNLAKQNSSDAVDYLVHFPQANNLISELLVAGYQKFLEGGALGLTNATEQNVDLWNQTGGNITFDGHSRGGITVGNALTSVKEQGGTGGTTNVNLYGSAYNAQDAANTVNQITNGAGQVKQSTHNYDFIGRILGGNEGTGGVIPPGSSALEEGLRTMGGKATVHNCYGQGNPSCNKRFGDDYVAPPLLPVFPSNTGGKTP